MLSLFGQGVFGLRFVQLCQASVGAELGRGEWGWSVAGGRMAASPPWFPPGGHRRIVTANEVAHRSSSSVTRQPAIFLMDMMD